MTNWIRADRAQAEKEAAVAAAYEDIRVMLREIYSRDGYMSPELKAIHDRLARAKTDPLAARDARVRAEALGEAASVADNYIPCPAAYGEYNSGESHAACEIERQILALIPADQEGGE